jgi:hypothetical protein
MRTLLICVLALTMVAVTMGCGGGPVATVTIGGAGGEVRRDGEWGYGVVLDNASATQDATDVAVTVSLLDGNGAVLERDFQTVKVIPADGTFYLGGGNMLGGTGKSATKVDVDVHVGGLVDSQYALPVATHVRIIRYRDGVSVRGRVTNDFEGQLSKDALIGCVLFGPDGEVVGGGEGYLAANLAPGRTAFFEIGSGTMAARPERVASAKVSISNDFILPVRGMASPASSQGD